VHAAPPLPAAGQREIDLCEICGSPLELALALFDGVLELALERVRLAADALARVGVEAR
jgi:hypothetical protein